MNTKRNLSRKGNTSTRKNGNLAALGSVYNEIGNLGTIPNRNVPTGNLLGLNRPPNVRPNALPNNLASLIPKSFDAGLFLDNDTKHIERVALCGPKMIVRKVAGIDGMPSVPIRNPGFKRHLYGEHIAKLSDVGKAASLVIMKMNLWKAWQAQRMADERLDPGSGIRQEDVDFVKTWVREREGQKLAVLLDYDRTITEIEGGYFIANSFEELKAQFATFRPHYPFVFTRDLPGFTLEGFVDYYVGGPERVAMLQDMFDFLYERNVAVYLLTNNTACQRARGLFEETMKVLTRGRPIVILCGADFGYDKKKTIQEQSALGPNAALKGLCTAVGGKRRRKTRRQKKH